MPKIAYNCMLLGGYFSGVEVTIQELAHALLAHQNVELHLILPEYAKFSSSAENLVTHSVRIPHSRLSRIIWEHSRLSLRLPADCDLLHCPGYISPVCSNLPTVLTIHDCFALRYPQWCKLSNHLYFKLFMGRSVRSATQIIVASNYVKQEVMDLFQAPEEKINIIPFAASGLFKRIDSAEKLADVRKRYQLPESFILHTGNHEPKKNIETLLKAYQKVRQTCNTKLVLSGRDGWGVNLRQTVADLGLDDDVLFTGYVPFADLPAIYSLADLFVFPSWIEGFGIPVLEAMACETPVICSNTGALPEITGNAALLIDPGKPDVLAEAIIEVLNTPSLATDLAQKGFINAKKYSWQQTASKTINLYNNILHQAPTP